MSLKQGWFTRLDQSYTDDRENMATSGGQRNIRWSNGCAYRWVQNKTGGSVIAGAVLFWGTNDNTKAEVYSLGQGGKGTAANMMAGVTQTAIASDAYGWIQIFGYCPVVSVESTTDILVQDALIGASTFTYAVKGTAVGTAPVHKAHIIALEGRTTNDVGAIKGEVNCYR